MKSKSLFLLLCLSVSFVSAQTFTLSPRVISGSSSNADVKDFLSTMTNNAASPADSMFEWTIIKYSPPSAWDVSFCDPDNCYGALNLGLNHTFKITKNSSGPMKATYIYNNTGGNDTLRIVVQSQLNPGNRDTVTYIVNAWMTGLNDIKNTISVNVYPNPVKDLLHVKLSAAGPFTLEIYNILGVCVKSFTQDGTTTNVGVADLKNGIYFIRFKAGNTVYSKSFTKSE